MPLENSSAKCFALLSRILLDGNGINRPGTQVTAHGERDELHSMIASFTEQDWNELHSLASVHHVIMRAFRSLRWRLLGEGLGDRADWLEKAIERERARIDYALSILSPICVALADVGTVTVINSLDHWPDLGIDLDLYSDGEPAAVVATMRNRFHAQPAKRSWGDRLASKWNFVVPGLPELVDVHVGRLGHMGEQSLIGESLVAGAVPVPFESHTFRVPAPEDRIMISTLQQMYSHFRIRLCDILELVQLADQGVIDYDYLRSLAQLTGIWDGVATYLKLVSDYVTAYRGSALLLPSFVISAARFGNVQVQLRRNFLRVPVVPHCLRLYASELKRLLWNGEINSTLRLSLMPALATASALKHKITESDKRIW